MIPFNRKIIVFKLIVLLLLLQFANNYFTSDFGLIAQTSQTCDKNLENADDAYYDGEFNEALRLIGLCLNQSEVSDKHRSLAYTIFSRTLMAMDNTQKAREYIGKILDLKPDYLPTIEQETPKYVNLVLLVRKEREQQIELEEDSGISSWVWIGAGSAVAAAAVIVLISSGDENEDKDKKPLPEPPEFP